MRSWPFISKIRRRFAPLPACPWRGRRRNRCCIRRSACFARRPGRRSTRHCWSAPDRKSWKAVRVMTRLLRRAGRLPGAPEVRWRDRRRLAKKRARAIDYSRGKAKKRALYHELIAAAQATRAELQAVAAGLAETVGMAAERWRAGVNHYLPLIARIIAQSERRVLKGEAVPAGEKLVSLFEPHADIIVKGGRQVQYGHKLNLATGKSGLILDVVVRPATPPMPSASCRCS